MPAISPLYATVYPEAATFNAAASAAFARLQPEDFIRRTHFVSGR